LSEQYLVSSDYSGLLVLWDLKSATVLHKLTGHTSSIPNISVIPGQNVLISGSHDGSIRLWDGETGVQKVALEIEDRDDNAIQVRGRKFKETVTSMLVLKDGRIIAGGVGGFVRVWDALMA
jgi:WD40 repeat protein